MIERFLHSFIELNVHMYIVCMCTTVDHHVIDRITLMWFPGIFPRFSFFFFFQFDKRIIDKWQHPSWKYVRTKLITFRPAKPKSCSLSYIPDVIPEGNVAKIKVTDVVKGQLISKKNCRAITSSKKRTKRTQGNILSAFSSLWLF